MSTSNNWLSRLTTRARKHPWIAGAVSVLVVGAVTVVLVWFQPQALLFDRVVDEELPIGSGESIDNMDDESMDDESMDDDKDDMDDMDDDMEEEEMGPIALSSGSFESRNRYTVEGTATIHRLDDGTRVLRLEDFSSTNGPDLYVYLTSADSGEGDPALESDFVDLGLLTGNIGNQNYPIGDGVDLDRYDTVVIWCRRFSVGFGAADLIAAR